VTAAHEWLPSNCASNSSFADRRWNDCFAKTTGFVVATYNMGIVPCTLSCTRSVVAYPDVGGHLR